MTKMINQVSVISDPEQTEEKEWRSVRSMTGDTCLISAAVGTRGPTEILISVKPDTFITTSIANETQKDRRTASCPSKRFFDRYADEKDLTECKEYVQMCLNSINISF